MKTMKERRLAAQLKTVSPAFLRHWPLPKVEAQGDKESRGRVLVIGGTFGMSGAVILAATSALRAGAGKLQVAVPESMVNSVAQAVPECMVIPLNESKPGKLHSSAAQNIIEAVDKVDVLVIGPGMKNSPGLPKFILVVVKAVPAKMILLDAAALESVRQNSRQFQKALRGRTIMTPHAGEMAHLIGRAKSFVENNAPEIAKDFAVNFGLTTILKGGETVVADSSGEMFLNRSGGIGLATSGSGDCLAGLIAGLSARGGGSLQAAVWGVHVHGKAGEALARRFGAVGYLARELPAEYPIILRRLEG